MKIAAGLIALVQAQFAEISTVAPLVAPTTTTTTTTVDYTTQTIGSSWNPFACGDCGCCCSPEHQPYCDYEIQTDCSTSKDCQKGWMCNFDYMTSGFCEDCSKFTTTDDCIADTFITEFGTNECINQCVKEAKPTRAERQVAKLKAKMAEFVQQWMATPSQPDRGSKLMMQFNNNAQEMLDHYAENYKVNCIIPAADEEDEEIERYLVGCTGAKRLPQQLAKWSAIYNANCDGTSSKFSRNKAKRMNRQQSKFEKRLEC